MPGRGPQTFKKVRKSNNEKNGSRKRWTSGSRRRTRLTNPPTVKRIRAFDETTVGLPGDSEQDNP